MAAGSRVRDSGGAAGTEEPMFIRTDGSRVGVPGGGGRRPTSHWGALQEDEEEKQGAVVGSAWGAISACPEAGMGAGAATLPPGAIPGGRPVEQRRLRVKAEVLESTVPRGAGAGVRVRVGAGALGGAAAWSEGAGAEGGTGAVTVARAGSNGDDEEGEWSPEGGGDELPEGETRLSMREELVRLMQLRFLNGLDGAWFDYSSVDNDPHLLTEQDAETERRREEEWLDVG